jgi:hypothetical protein
LQDRQPDVVVVSIHGTLATVSPAVADFLAAAFTG